MFILLGLIHTEPKSFLFDGNLEVTLLLNFDVKNILEKTGSIITQSQWNEERNKYFDFWDKVYSNNYPKSRINAYDTNVFIPEFKERLDRSNDRFATAANKLIDSFNKSNRDKERENIFTKICQLSMKTPDIFDTFEIGKKRWCSIPMATVGYSAVVLASGIKWMDKTINSKTKYENLSEKKKNIDIKENKNKKHVPFRAGRVFWDGDGQLGAYVGKIHSYNKEIGMFANTTNTIVNLSGCPDVLLSDPFVVLGPHAAARHSGIYSTSGNAAYALGSTISESMITKIETRIKPTTVAYLIRKKILQTGKDLTFDNLFNDMNIVRNLGNRLCQYMINALNILPFIGTSKDEMNKITKHSLNLLFDEYFGPKNIFQLFGKFELDKKIFYKILIGTLILPTCNKLKESDKSIIHESNRLVFIDLRYSMLYAAHGEIVKIIQGNDISFPGKINFGNRQRDLENYCDKRVQSFKNQPDLFNQWFNIINKCATKKDDTSVVNVRKLKLIMYQVLKRQKNNIAEWTVRQMKSTPSTLELLCQSLNTTLAALSVNKYKKIGGKKSTIAISMEDVFDQFLTKKSVSRLLSSIMDCLIKDENIDDIDIENQNKNEKSYTNFDSNIKIFSDIVLKIFGSASFSDIIGSSIGLKYKGYNHLLPNVSILLKILDLNERKINDFQELTIKSKLMLKFGIRDFVETVIYLLNNMHRPGFIYLVRELRGLFYMSIKKMISFLLIEILVSTIDVDEVKDSASIRNNVNAMYHILKR